MKITIDAPNGCGIKRDQRVRKLTIVAENVGEQEKLYRAAALFDRFLQGVEADAKAKDAAKAG